MPALCTEHIRRHKKLGREGQDGVAIRTFTLAFLFQAYHASSQCKSGFF